MTLEPITDHGQTITPPAGKVIGFIDGKAEFEAFAEAVRAAGYPASKITSLYGEDGIHLLERLKKNSFFFGDSEDSMIQLSIRELEQVTAIEGNRWIVWNQDDMTAATTFATIQEARSSIYSALV